MGQKISSISHKSLESPPTHSLRRLYESHKTHFPSCHSHTSAELLPYLCTIKLEALGFTYHLVERVFV
jgi:hypothetical protein